MNFDNYGGDRFRPRSLVCESHVEVAGRPLKTPGKKPNANYNPVAEAESILAEGALNVPQFVGTSPLVSVLGY